MRRRGTCHPTSEGDADYRGLTDTLAALRQAHPSATLRFVGDRPAAVRAVARDRRLFSAELYLSEWSHAQHPGEGEYPGEEQNEGRERRLTEATPVATALVGLSEPSPRSRPRAGSRAMDCARGRARVTRRPVHA